ncbi:hypothetical protein BOTBODRAFT_35960 [Botryobasidium botryosum FD-172 SS1]|uniref:Glucose-methanol-choline oxidoreductase N-terminal domain-containing protein n=1 Tax=Botryobasidium botryosum (strain FD-172 SS1) TaxID=930990 RepID=A0A067MGC0_BOTB1|nr:hypothetical protein BOTBODRAFT_35960 [Botryobasidium botryosum FD-172 SS1]
MASRTGSLPTPTASIQEVANKTFDYVIIGGGTAGLVVAARLSEDPSVTVCVLEAGSANLDEPAILVPVQYGIHIGNPQFDWAFMTTPQPYANNAPALWPRGKGLGGTSGINFSFYQRPLTFDIDAIKRLGNPDWNWSRFLDYSKKVESFQPPTPEEADLNGYKYNLDSHGTDGPLLTTFPFKKSETERAFQKALSNLGAETPDDFMNGNICGVWSGLTTMDRETGNRSYSANAYYAPNASRENLKVLTNAPSSRLIFAPAGGEHGEVQADGVVFTHGGEIYTVHARREVILSAGTLKSPQILELSGIGDPSLLRPLGIDVRVDLPGVGANVQDHIYGRVVFEIDSSDKWETYDALQNSDFAREQLALYQSSREGIHTFGIGTMAYLPLKSINPEAAESVIASLVAKVAKLEDSALKEQWTLTLEALKSDNAPDCEITFIPGAAGSGYVLEAGKKHVTIVGALNHPLSRGAIHITSTNAAEQAAMDSHLFEQDEDLQIMAEILKYCRKIAATDPFKDLVVRELGPGPECVSDEQFREHAKRTTESFAHTAGSCSMLPREKGGVVDSRFKVYGTANVRVVDLSILPLHIMAHPQAFVYAIAEQAADIIKGVA